MTGLTIRKARVKDARKIVPLSTDFLKQHSSYSPLDVLVPPTKEKETRSWEKRIRSRKYTVFVAESEGSILGFMTLLFPKRYSFKKVRDVGEIEVMAVSSKARGRGVGKAMFEEAKKYFRSKGVSHLQINVRLKNPALGFWKKLGFKEYDVKLYRKL